MPINAMTIIEAIKLTCFHQLFILEKKDLFLHLLGAAKDSPASLDGYVPVYRMYFSLFGS